VDPADPFDLSVNSVVPITATCRPLTAGQTDVRVNVVNLETRAVMNAWLISVTATEPPTSRVFDLVIQHDKGSSKRVALNNPYPHPVTFGLRTDKPHLLRFKEDSVLLPAQAQGFIGLRFSPTNLTNTVEEMLVFVTDVDDRVDECLRIRARYI